MFNVQVTAPSELATKQLKITQYADGKRKVQISTNLLELFGYPKGTEVTESSLGDGLGYMIQKAKQTPLVNKVKRIYSRFYKRRKTNPFETNFETSSKKILDKSIPKTSTHVHVTITEEGIYVRPIENLLAERLQKMMDTDQPLSVFGACTSGIDLHAAHSQGFEINSVLEWRPQEKRDKRDLTETGIMSVLGNVPVKQVFNEDITTVSEDMLDWLTRNSQSSVFTVSLQCDEYSNIKASSLKEQSLTDLSSTLDMALDALRIIKKLKFPMILLEQVAPFQKSTMGDVWDLRLRKMGYKTFSKVIDARDHNGHSSRKRYFHFATSLPTEFSFPEESARNSEPVWESLVAKYLDKMRNVTHSKAMQDGLKCGRLRTIKKDSLHVPTLLKSQQRMAKDSCVVMDGDQILFPTLEMEAEIMGLPENFNLDVNSQTISSEIIGQGVDYPLYADIMGKVKEHILTFLEQFKPKSYLQVA